MGIVPKDQVLKAKYLLFRRRALDAFAQSMRNQFLPADQLLALNWQKSNLPAAALSAVPEPSTLAMLVIAIGLSVRFVTGRRAGSLT